MTRFTLKFVPIIFGIVGVALLGTGGWLAIGTINFKSAAAITDGIVLRLDRRYSTDSDGNSGYLYYPVVQFTSSSGGAVEFRGSTGASPPVYRKGERVTVLYNPETPDNARIDSFTDLWLGSLITGTIGLVFTCIGAGFLIVRAQRAKLEAWIRDNGQRVEVDYTGVFRDTSFRVNGQAPWRITAQWQDPVRKNVHVFKSKRLWFDPEPFIDRDRLTVLIDPKNPKRHMFDLSFLPEPAE